MTDPSTSTPLPPLTPRAWLRYDVVSRLLDGIPTRTVLEIGCGQGSMGARLAARGRYLGVEPDQASRMIGYSFTGPPAGLVSKPSGR